MAADDTLLLATRSAVNPHVLANGSPPADMPAHVSRQRTAVAADSRLPEVMAHHPIREFESHLAP